MTRVAKADLRRHCQKGESFGPFMDTPASYSMEEVMEMAEDRDLWRGWVEKYYKIVG